MKNYLTVAGAKVDKMLDNTTMYRVVLNTLLGLVAISWIWALFGFITYSPWELVTSLLVIMTAALVSNHFFAKMVGVESNTESVIVTGLILYFLLSPPLATINYLWLAFVAVVAMASKYVFVYRGQHIFNPAAFGAAALSLFGLFAAYWWVATPALLIPVILLGVLVVSKVRRWPLVFVMIAVSGVTYLTHRYLSGADMLNIDTYMLFLSSTPVLFLAAYMLTEPFTLPPRLHHQIFYGALVGFLSSTVLFNFTYGDVYFRMSPELALLLGNLAVLPFLLRQKLILKLEKVEEIAAQTYEYSFSKPSGLKFLAGQYLEWMLPHKQSDNRGVRRYFTISSAPTETDVRVAMKVPPSGASSYKNAIVNMEPGDKIIASQLAGDFVLPKDKDKKIAAVAGGIGVTPFSSQVQYLIDTETKRDYKLFYAVNLVNELAYMDKWKVASEKFAFDLVPIVANDKDHAYETGFMRKELIEKYTPDFKERIWYISGPQIMVNITEKTLLEMGVRRTQIRKDFFPGIG